MSTHVSFVPICKTGVSLITDPSPLFQSLNPALRIVIPILPFGMTEKLTPFVNLTFALPTLIQIYTLP